MTGDQGSLALTSAPEPRIDLTDDDAEWLAAQRDLSPRTEPSRSADALRILPDVPPSPLGSRRGAAFGKAVFDRGFAALLLLALAPILVLIALAVKITSRGPVLYRQPRVGLGGRVFFMLKFRSMRGTGDEYGEADADWAAAVVGEQVTALPFDRRTAVGKFIRHLNLDELPQLLNILKGDMSLVGPRPERASYVDRFALHLERYEERHSVRPGLTGWAQVNGLRGATSLQLRLAYDLYYIEHWSPLLDLRILFRTIPSMFLPPEPGPEWLLSIASVNGS